MSGEAPRGKSAFREWLHTNQGIGAALTALLGIYLISLQLSTWAHKEQRDGFTLGFFPAAGAVLMLIFTVALMLDSRRRDRNASLERVSWGIFLFCLAVVVGCGVYFYLMAEIGFLLVSPFFLFIFIYAMGLRPWTSALIAAAVMTLVVYAVFRLIGIELPPGILPI